MDIDAIKSKLSHYNQQQIQKITFGNLNQVKQVVRIVLYKHNKDNPFIELFFHYNLGNNKKLTYHLFHLEDQTQLNFSTN